MRLTFALGLILGILGAASVAHAQCRYVVLDGQYKHLCDRGNYVPGEPDVSVYRRNGENAARAYQQARQQKLLRQQQEQEQRDREEVLRELREIKQELRDSSRQPANTGHLPAGACPAGGRWDGAGCTFDKR